MKIVVTSRGDSLDSQVDTRFGRARYFIVIDPDSVGFELVDNKQNVNAPEGAGIQAAQTVADHGVSYVLSGHCGPKAFRALSASGIKVIVGVSDCTVREAVEKFKQDKLQETKEADVEGH
jgi:predicted Fe-Mo cluster-binding NifX family protein